MKYNVEQIKELLTEDSDNMMLAHNAWCEANDRKDECIYPLDDDHAHLAFETVQEAVKTLRELRESENNHDNDDIVLWDYFTRQYNEKTGKPETTVFQYGLLDVVDLDTITQHIADNPQLLETLFDENPYDYVLPVMNNSPS